MAYINNLYAIYIFCLIKKQFFLLCSFIRNYNNIKTPFKLIMPILLSFIPFTYLGLFLFHMTGLYINDIFVCNLIYENNTLVDIGHTYGRNARRDMVNEELAAYKTAISNNQITRQQVSDNFGEAVTKMQQANVGQTLTLNDAVAIKHMSELHPYSEVVAKNLSGMGNPDAIHLTSNTLNLKFKGRAGILAELNRVKVVYDSQA